jgi:hypothetical protein
MMRTGDASVTGELAVATALVMIAIASVRPGQGRRH